MPGTVRRKQVGLALGGGVARGLAHIGVLSVLEREGIPIDFVAGTSAGSLIGATFCAGMKLSKIEEAALGIKWWDLAHPVWPSQGFVSFEPLERWLVKQIGELKFEDLKIPFAAVAADLNSGDSVRLCKGWVAPAVRASCSVPGFVTPILLNGRLLGDGSLANTVPVDILQEMGADYVIGVDIFTSSIRPRWGPFGMAFTAVEILVQRAGGGIETADCLIQPEVAGESYVRFSRRKQFIELGKKAAQEKIDCIRSAIFN